MRNKSIFKTTIFTSICFIVIGLLLLLKSETTIEVMSYILGGFIIALGISSFIRYVKSKQEEKPFRFDIVYGIVSVLAGLLLILNPHALASIIPFILGIWMTISSAMRIQYAVQLKGIGSRMWTGTLVMGSIMLICGVVLIFNPFKGAVLITRIIGSFLIIYAVLDVISAYIVKKNLKDTIQYIEQ